MSAQSGAMELEQRHLEQIGEYVKSRFAEWMGESNPARNRTDPLLLERMVRVEEELKAQRDLMQQGFNAIDKRFEAVEKRFEDLIHYMDKRFESMEKRFDAVDKRFESMEKRFEAVDKRFESTDRKLESLNRSLRIFIYSSFSFTAAAAGVIIAVLKLT